jgi:hypothetical protein
LRQPTIAAVDAPPEVEEEPAPPSRSFWRAMFRRPPV